MRIVHISDVHGKWHKLKIPTCDILISTGDYSFTGEDGMVSGFHKWMNAQPATHKISVQGNHETRVEKDFQFYKDKALKECPDLHFIDEGLLEIEGKKIWCSAITPFFCNWAWNRHRGDKIKRHWDKIPLDIDILATHGPVMGILDKVGNEHVGCQDLSDKIKELKNLKLHLCGHIHDQRGIEHIEGITYSNASICNDRYEAVNDPIVIDF